MKISIMLLVVLCVVVFVQSAPASTGTIENYEGKSTHHVVKRFKRQSMDSRLKLCRHGYYRHPASGVCQDCQAFLDIFTEEQMCDNKNFDKACGEIVKEYCFEDD